MKLRPRHFVFALLGVLLSGLAWAFVREARAIRTQGVSSWSEDSLADCAVVVTGGPSRIREGFDLLSRRSVQKLIISGVHPQVELRDIFPLWPYYGELREQDVVLERRSQTTYGNAVQTLPLVEALRCRDLVLITSRLHMRRTVNMFRSEFPQGFPIIPRAVLGQNSVEPGWWELANETLKSLFYDLWAY
jgi:uncharacterized SAM-binding protein YcdF (DUF218 family)